MDPMLDLSDEDIELDRDHGGEDLEEDASNEDDIKVEEDVYAYQDPDDPVQRVLDVYLADDLEDNMYLLQYPMRPADRPLNTPSAVRVKVANHLIEVEHSIKQGGKHFDSNAPPQLRQVTQTHTGSRVRPATNFAFGVIRSNELHMTPIHATMQMRPSFQHIDEAKALEIELDLDDPAHKAKDDKPQQLSFKKKESERATAARKSTYAYKKSVEEAEPWVPLEVHGQNDQLSLDEFSRMFFDKASEHAQTEVETEFPAPERYLEGLNYMEEYDENGESSAGIVGRSQEEMDLAAARTSSASLHRLAGDAKVVGFLKLAHLVPFSMLLDVSSMSPEAVLEALGIRGGGRGFLLRGNWAARPVDIWPKGPSYAADCLSVAQVMLHRYGAVSRPDLQRRFPNLAPATLKELLSNIAEMDSAGRRWVPKLRDGIAFGLDYPDVVEEEEERWRVHASNLEARLGKKVLERPSCETFNSFTEVLKMARREVSSMTSKRYGHPSSTSPGEDLSRLKGESGASRGGASGSVDDPDAQDDLNPDSGFLESKASSTSVAAVKQEMVATSSERAAGTIGGKAPRRHFRPKRPAKTAESLDRTNEQQVDEGDSARDQGKVQSVRTVTDIEGEGGEDNAMEASEMTVEEVPEVEQGIVRIKQGTSSKPREDMAVDAGEEQKEAPADPEDDIATPADPEVNLATPAASEVNLATPAAPEGGLVTPALAKPKEELREMEKAAGGGCAEGEPGSQGAGAEQGGGSEDVVKVEGAVGKAKEEPRPARGARPKVRPRPNRSKPKG